MCILFSLSFLCLKINLRVYRKKHLSKYDADSLLPINDSDDLSSSTMDNENLSSLPSTRSALQTEIYFSKETICFGDEDGNQPKDGNIVQIHYTIQIKDERTNVVKIIECSRSNNETSSDRGPFEFVLGIGQVIQGLEEAIKSMHCGERSIFTIPFVYAYGEDGISPAVPPKSDLICDVELFNCQQRKLKKVYIL